MADSDATALVLDDRQKALVQKNKRKALKKIAAASGFMAGVGTVSVLALAALLFNGLHLAGWAIVPFFLVVCTVSGWLFGGAGASLFFKRDSDD